MQVLGRRGTMPGVIVTTLNFCGIMLLNVIIIYDNFEAFLIWKQYPVNEGNGDLVI